MINFFFTGSQIASGEAVNLLQYAQVGFSIAVSSQPKAQADNQRVSYIKYYGNDVA